MNSSLFCEPVSGYGSIKLIVILLFVYDPLTTTTINNWWVNSGPLRHKSNPVAIVDCGGN